MSLPEGHRAVIARISGRVQGVWFRNWTVDQAKALGLYGWVRNRKDQTVEAMFVGPADKVLEMLQLCQKGPPAAEVLDVSVSEAKGICAPDFVRKPTV